MYFNILLHVAPSSYKKQQKLEESQLVVCSIFYSCEKTVTKYARKNSVSIPAMSKLAQKHILSIKADKTHL